MSWQQLLEALARPDFYVEMIIIAGVVMTAWFIALILRRKAAAHLDRHPPHRFTRDFFLKPLELLAPLLAFFLLSLAKPFAERFAGGSAWTHAAMQIALAFTLARAVTLVVKSRGVAYFLAGVILVLTLLDVTGFMASTKEALADISFGFGKIHISMLNLVQGIIILVVVFWFATLLSKTLENYLRKSSRLTYNTRELVVKFVKVTAYFIAFLITLGSLGIDLTALAIFGGALGVGIGLGLQKITSNFVSGVTLLMERSIKIGDIIEIDGDMGWVRQLNIRYALIETFDGREVLVPNEQLMTSKVTNWTFSTSRARAEFTVGVAYGSDPDLVKKLILESIRESKLTLDHPEPFCYLNKFNDSSLDFVTAFWVQDLNEGRYRPTDDVLCRILKKFAENDIEIPFPQRVVTVRQPYETSLGATEKR